MNVLRKALIILLLSSTSVMAVPASEESIKQLFSVTQVQKQLDAVNKQLDIMMNNSIQQCMKGKSPTPGTQQAINNMKNKMLALFQEEITWEKLEPMYLRLYKESFSEEEIVGMLSFYKTPAGQAFINKMPVLAQKTMQEFQTFMSSYQLKMKNIQKEFEAEINTQGK